MDILVLILIKIILHAVLKQGLHLRLSMLWMLMMLQPLKTLSSDPFGLELFLFSFRGLFFLRKNGEEIAKKMF